MDIEQIIFDSPLYSRWNNDVIIEEDGEEKNYTIDYLIKTYNKRVELYCTECERMRVFAADKNIIDIPDIRNPHFPQRVIDKPSLFKTFRCSGNENHKRLYSFLVVGKEIIKVAEYPSKYDSVKNTFNSYKKILDKEKITELAKASQLESYGYPIAAFLYYRRIFEHIILQTFKDSDISDKISEEEFKTRRMEDKVDYVKEFLPEYFTDNSHMYGVLSKGIHELQEKECEEYLPVVKTIIFFSLDEAVDKKNKEIRKIEVAKKLNEIKSKLK